MNSGGFVHVRRLLVVAAVVLTAGLGLGACSGDGGDDGLLGALEKTPQTATTLRTFGYADEEAIDKISDGQPDSVRFKALSAYATGQVSGSGPSLRDNEVYLELANCLGPDVVAARFAQPVDAASQAQVLAVGVRAESGKSPVEVWCTAVKQDVDAQAMAGRVFERLAGPRQNGRLWSDSIGEPDVEVYGDLGVIRVIAAPPDPKTVVFGQFLQPLATGELDQLTKP
ncbi:hypothetical protein [Flindersiella endophytica]